MTSQSEQIDQLAKALAAVQGEVENASKNAANPHFRSKYADLAEILNTVRPVLAKHGIAVVQLPGWEDGMATVSTTLMHESGQWIRGIAAAPLSKADAQGVGSVTTYLRRYSLAAACGIAQEDDDGNAASGGQSNGQAQRVVLADAAQRKELGELGRILGEEAVTYVTGLMSSTLTKDTANEELKKLRGRVAKLESARA